MRINEPCIEWSCFSDSLVTSVSFVDQTHFWPPLYPVDTNNELDNCIVTIKLFPIETFTFKKIMWARDYVSSLKSILIKIVSVRTFGSTLQVTRLRDGAVSQL